MTAREDRILEWAIIASQFAPPFMFSGVAVLLPTMGIELNAGAVSLGLVETLFLAGSLAFLLPVGRLADAADKRTLYKLSLLTFALTSLLIGTLSSMPAILAIRFLQGLTSAVTATTGPAILAEIVPAEKRGSAFGRAIGAVYAGLTFGPVAAGFLIDLWGWRAVFWCGALILFAGTALIHVMMPSSWKNPNHAVHGPSTVLMLAAVLCLVGGSATLRNGALGYALFAAGLAMGVGFVFVQKNLTRPLVDVRALMANHELRSALFVQLLLYMNAYTSVFMLSIYMQVVLHQPAKTSGQVLAVGSVIMAVLAPVAGSLADRYRPAKISTVGCASVLVMAVLARTLTEHSELSFIMIVLGAQGLGFALFSSPNMASIMNSVPKEAVGMASALGAKSRSLGMVTGMLVTGVLISLYIGNDAVEQHPDRFVALMHTAFTVLAISTSCALVISAWHARRGAVTPSRA